MRQIQTEAQQEAKASMAQAASEIKGDVTAQIEAANKKLKAFQEDNERSVVNIKTQAENIEGISNTIGTVNNVLTGMQERVIGIERNVGHMTAAVNNLTQTMMNM